MDAATYYGEAEHVTLSGTPTKVHPARARIVAADPSSSGFAFRLPNAETDPWRFVPGENYFLLVNLSSSNTADVEDASGSTLATIATESAVEVHLLGTGGGGRWLLKSRAVLAS
ncbi:MAG: hypothetical protein ACF8XB_04070 [Planctomycetota bacterium JB042]